MRLSPTSLPVKLCVAIGSVLLVFILLGMGLNGWIWFRDHSKMLNEHGLNTVRETASLLDKIFVRAELAVSLLTDSLERNPPEKKALPGFLRKQLEILHSECPELIGLAVAYRENALVPDEKRNAFIAYLENGKSLCRRIPGDVDFDYAARDWFVVPVTLEKAVWTIPFYAESGMNCQLLSYSAPFYCGKQGRRVGAGAAAVDIGVEHLGKYLLETELSGLNRLSESSEIFLLNQFGQIILYPARPELVNNTIFSLCDQSEHSDPADRVNAKKMLKDSYGKIALARTPLLNNGSCEIFYASCVNNWTVCIAIPMNWVQRILQPFLAEFLAGWLFALLIVTALIFWICGRLNAPLLKLTKAAESFGKGDFSAELPERNNRDEIGMLTESFRRMRSELAEHIEKLRESITARERSEGELNAAKAIQKDLLPHQLPPFGDFRNIQCAADLFPARGVGGDLYDIVPLNRDVLAVIIGDVSGKGIPAALFMSMVQMLQRSIAPDSSSPRELVVKLNDILSGSENSSRMFATYWAGFLNVRTGALVYCNAGHNPPLVKRKAGSVETLKDRHGPPAGAVSGRAYGGSETRLFPGDSLLLYTDGVTEAFNRNNVMFGFERLRKTVERTHASTPRALLDSVREAVFSFTDGAEQSDDIALLALSIPNSVTVDALPENLPFLLSFASEFPEIDSLCKREKNRVMICLEEIFANICSYAYEKEKPGKVSLKIWTDGGEIRMRYSDSGKPYDPTSAPEPNLEVPLAERKIGGLGIFLVRSYMSTLEYSRSPEGLNLLTMGFPL